MAVGNWNLIYNLWKEEQEQANHSDEKEIRKNWGRLMSREQDGFSLLNVFWEWYCVIC